MSLEEKIGQKSRLSFRSGWTMKDGTKIVSVQTSNNEIDETIGSKLNAVGVNVNFAPDADVNNNPVIGLRSFSSNPQIAAKFVSKVFKVKMLLQWQNTFQDMEMLQQTHIQDYNQLDLQRMNYTK